MKITLHGLLSMAFIIAGLSSCQKEITALEARKIQNNEVVETNPANLNGFTEKIGYNVAGYYAALPYLYDSTTKSYPLIVTLHGAGQYGNGGSDLPKLLTDGIPKLLIENKFPPNFSVDGKNYSFVVLAPQLTTDVAISEIQNFVDYATKKYRIDKSRIYLSGISIGSVMSWQMSAAHATELAAVVPFSGIDSLGSLPANADIIAKSGLPVWAFQNDDDPLFKPTLVKDFISLINSKAPMVPVRLTENATGGHDTWTKGTDPNYTENGLNIYQWMLQYHR